MFKPFFLRKSHQKKAGPEFNESCHLNLEYLEYFLDKLATNHIPLSIQVDEVSINLSIQSINYVDKQITFAPVRCLDEHKILAKKPYIIVRSLDSHSRIEFETRITTIELHEGQPTYTASYPPQFTLLENREDFRLPITQHEKIRLQLSLFKHSLPKCRIQNISASGIQGTISGMENAEIRIDDKLKFILNHTTLKSPISGELTVRHIKRRAAFDEIIFGAQFISTNNSFNNQIDRLITQIQRHTLYS